MSLKTEFQALLTLTELYLSRHQNASSLVTDKDTYTFFKNLKKPAYSPKKPKAIDIPRAPLPPPVKKALPKKPKVLQKEAPPPPHPPKKAPVESSEFKPLIEKFFPHVRWLDQIPDETSIKNQTAPSKASVLMLYSKEHPFFQKLCQAIDSHLRPCEFHSIEKPPPFENYALILIEKATLSLDSKLRKQYESGFLKEIPCLTLESPFSYEKDPKLKRGLWNILKQKLD